MESAKEWIVKWFEKKGELHVGDVDQNYFELGLIDSFGILDLIDNLESEFDIRLNEQHFSERRFGTITGLSCIVEELIAQKRNN